jgi:hypothetical protein
MSALSCRFLGHVTASNDSAALDDANQNQHHSSHEKDVNDPTHCVGGYKAKRPKYDKNNGNCPQHGVSSYEARLRIGWDVFILGACHNMCEMACVARRETSRGSELYCAALSNTVRISSPSGTVFGMSVLMSFALSWDAPGTYSSFRAIN